MESVSPAAPSGTPLLGSAWDNVSTLARSGSPDGDVSPFLERAQLGPDWLAAREHEDLKAGQSPAQPANVSRHLSAEFPRRAEHERLEPLPLELNLLQNREREGRGLPTACLRLANEIAALQQHRDALGLDGRNRLELQLLKALKQRG